MASSRTNRSPADASTEGDPAATPPRFTYLSRMRGTLINSFVSVLRDARGPIVPVRENVRSFVPSGLSVPRGRRDVRQNGYRVIRHTSVCARLLVISAVGYIRSVIGRPRRLSEQGRRQGVTPPVAPRTCTIFAISTDGRRGEAGTVRGRQAGWSGGGVGRWGRAVGSRGGIAWWVGMRSTRRSPGIADDRVGYGRIREITLLWSALKVRVRDRPSDGVWHTWNVSRADETTRSTASW